MKRIFLPFLIVVFAVFSSCSSDDSSGSANILRAKIDGTEYIFNTFQIEEVHYPDEGYTDVEITASINNDPSRTISIIATQGVTGSDASWYFAYFLDETAFPKEDSFTTLITESTSSFMKGQFAGTVKSTEDDTILQITDGSFEVSY